MVLSKVRSGIDGFDDLVKGGLPREKSILITGGTGTGKSTFAMQFVYKGAKVYDEPGIYVTMEESVSSILKNSSTYGLSSPRIIMVSTSQCLDPKLMHTPVTFFFYPEPQRTGA